MAKIDPPPTLSEPPANLGQAGTAFWHSIVTEYDISDGAGLAVLEQAAFAYDRVAQLRARIDEDGAILCGRNGPREHPGLKAELAGRAFVVKSLEKLGLTVEAIKAPGRQGTIAWKGPLRVND